MFIYCRQGAESWICSGPRLTRAVQLRVSMALRPSASNQMSNGTLRIAGNSEPLLERPCDIDAIKITDPWNLHLALTSTFRVAFLSGSRTGDGPGCHRRHPE